MFGIGGPELVIVGVICLLLFGPAKAGDLARDLGRLTSKARASVEELKSELTLGEDQDRKGQGLPNYKKP